MEQKIDAKNTIIECIESNKKISQLYINIASKKNP